VTALTLEPRLDNLPADVTPFIGRRRELATIAAALDDHRLVTLRGPAGVGKTRLALQAAAAARMSFAGGGWLVELSALRTPELLARSVSGALGLPDEAAGDPLAALAANLAEREMLLVLDTCEHLIEPCAGLVRVLLEAAPGLRVLATSREPLDVPGEHALPVPPLSLPDDGADPAEAASSEAVALFADRARAAMPAFEVNAANVGAVSELCRRLDGIPLALELAAVRLRSMPVEEIVARLADRFRVLGTARTATGRHRTLAAAVAWSYDLCTPAEQRLWAELSVFPGGFSLPAADSVCGPDTLATLIRLVEKSVLQFSRAATTDPRAGRYQMLDTIREFGAQLLPADDAVALRRRHRDYYLGLARQAADGSLGSGQADWLVRLADETDNLRVALDFSFATPGEQAAGLAMTTALRTYWLMVGQFTEGRRWHDLAVAAEPETAANGWACYGAGVLAVQQGDAAAGDPLLAAAAALAASRGDADLAAHVTDARGIIAFHAGDLATAAAEHTAALETYREIGFSDPFALVTYSRLASVWLASGEVSRAAELAGQCLERCAELGEQWAAATALWVRGAARWMSGDVTAAIEDALTCLRVKESVNDLHSIAMCFDLLSVCLVAADDFERATVLHGAGDALWTLINAPVLMGPAYAAIREIAAATARDQLGDEQFAAAVRRGQALPLRAAIAVARGELPASARTADGTAGAGGAGGKQLTRREREIAALVMAGLGNREIAERLFLSKRTVDSHLEHIFAKLGFSSRTQLASWVIAPQGERRQG
jgi:predicted ATPase/DNA-binding CsgD family transcriptional regulator